MPPIRTVSELDALEALHSETRTVAREILTRWGNLVKSKQLITMAGDGFGRGYFEITLNPEDQMGDLKLTIQSDAHGAASHLEFEYTVYISSHHEHCDEERVIELIDEVVTEKTVVVEFMWGKTYQGSKFADPRDMSTVGSVSAPCCSLGCLATLIRLPRNFLGSRTRVVSWNGTYNTHEPTVSI